MKLLKKFLVNLQKNPPRVIALGFFGLILLGTGLLSLPFVTASGESTPFIDALFTATSAVCVTGLVPLVTASHWNPIGQGIILLLIQVGGLGIMTIATVVAILLGKRLTLRSRLLIQEQMSSKNMSGMVRLMLYVIASTFLIEAIGALLLAVQFVPEYGWKGIWYSIFQSISSFCNAGFDILGPDSLEPYVGSYWVILVISALIILGGIGFYVFMDITSYGLNFRRYTLHSKIALTMTGILLLSGTLVFLAVEYNNPLTLGDQPWPTKILGAFFQSVTTRTAGYASMNQKNLDITSATYSIFLMFLGGSPAGTAGGIKTTSFALLLITTLAEIRGNVDLEIFQRRIPFDLVRRAIALVSISILWVLFVTFMLTLMENQQYIDLLYETVSAFGTVGVTRNVTPFLQPSSKVLIILTMYLGRLGPMTLAYAIYEKKKNQEKKYKEIYGNVIIG